MPRRIKHSSPAAKARFWAGFDAYIDGKPEPDEPDAKRGWWHALDCHAQAELAHDEFQHLEFVATGRW